MGPHNWSSWVDHPPWFPTFYIYMPFLSHSQEYEGLIKLRRPAVSPRPQLFFAGLIEKPHSWIHCKEMQCIFQDRLVGFGSIPEGYFLVTLSSQCFCLFAAKLVQYISFARSICNIFSQSNCSLTTFNSVHYS